MATIGRTINTERVEKLEQEISTLHNDLSKCMEKISTLKSRMSMLQNEISDNTKAIGVLTEHIRHIK